MTSPTERAASVSLSVKNIGGIDSTEVAFDRGVNVLTGRNATNRTSTLQALMAAAGSDHASLKADADEGHVELTLDDETYERPLTRANGGITASGTPLLDDSELADLYAFLIESNEARRAVERGDDLRDVIMRPVDTEEIQAEVKRLEDEKRRIADELDELADLDRRLPELVEKKRRLEDELDEKRAELAAKETEIEESNADVEESRAEQAELDAKLEELQEIRSSLEDVRYNLETEQESVERLQEELDEQRDGLDELPDAPAGEVTQLDDQIDRLRRRKQSLESDVAELQSIIQFNRDMVEDGETDVLRSLEDSKATNGGEAVTDQLLDDQQTITCWTCGSDVERDRIDETTERIQQFQQEKRSELTELDAEITDFVSEHDDLREKQRRRDELERQIERTEAEIADREGRIEDLRQERDELDSELSDVNAEVEALRTEEYDDVLDLHKEANQLEFECDRLADDLEDARAEIDSIEDRLDERDALEERRSEIQTELADLRTRVDQIEREAVGAFNDHMDDLLDILGYDNLDRIWLERTERETRKGRRKISETQFDLHIVRSTESGEAYEDTVDHLSESEREVTGLVFALSGYLVHDVHEEVPFMVLDSLEAIDSERIADLITYFDSYSEYIVVALLPEDASALPDDYLRITDI